MQATDGESRARRFTLPNAGEDLEAIARRALPERPGEDAVRELQSWNLHLLARMRPGELLPSDVVFVEPPLPRTGPGAGDTEGTT